VAFAVSSLIPDHLAPGRFKEKWEDILGTIISTSDDAGALFSNSFLDKTRGVFNEGGLFGERKGWHLPGFDTSSWVSRDLSTGLPGGSAGVGFFVTTFTLNIPAGIDAFMSFTFEEPLGQDYRLYLFVNGWMMGKRVANLG
jgi:hypothetical protein